MTSPGSVKWMSDALAEAHAAVGKDEVPVGAVVVHEGRIIGRGHNLRETNQNPVAHAEVLAIIDAAKNLGSWRLTDCELYVTLEPCPMCLAACQQARLKSVVYGAKDPKGGAISLSYPLHEDPRTNHRFEVRYEEDILCGSVLTEFFQKKRKASKVGT